ncbi:MAG TPA: bifunctional DNA primase/polymerase [Casimicrobiaceae bacterium]
MAYAERGWSVIPIEPGGKRPLVAWEEFQRRIAAVDEMDDWFWRWSHANIAVVTGALSRLVVLDIDPEHGGAGSLDDLEEQHGRLPRTIEAATGSGGRHVYFTHPGRIVHNRVGLLPGVDLRGDGGYVVAPPSIHPNGTPYVWAPEHAPGEVTLAPLPPWLLTLSSEHRHYPHSREHWRELSRRDVHAGERNNTIASFAGHLIWHGVDREVVLELLLAWNRTRCDPPLTDDEVARTVASIAGLHMRRHEDPLQEKPESTPHEAPPRAFGARLGPCT